ncbi:hypothetical protein WR25_24563 [Diploscapter pachys]|uniref:Uncharacterized protein n=1 Tax=Diploscapter pachys TaxID=2018661 RepID=A0A2A2KG07_9BILA|nr:hypothetical protein WR25_24563 [Diploscapter pachys]
MARSARGNSQRGNQAGIGTPHAARARIDGEDERPFSINLNSHIDPTIDDAERNAQNRANHCFARQGTNFWFVRLDCESGRCETGNGGRRDGRCP